MKKPSGPRSFRDGSVVGGAFADADHLSPTGTSEPDLIHEFTASTIETRFVAEATALLSRLSKSSASESASLTTTPTATGNSVSLDTDKVLSPTLSVDAVNPTHVGLTNSGIVGDESGTVTFTDASGNQVIPTGATLELASAYSGTVSFAGATGTLIIDHSSDFSGTITGQLGIGNLIDLKDITAGGNATISYSGNNSPGTLTVSDGTHTANIALDGIYSLANFTASSDGHGGTFVVDPPVTQVAYSLRQVDGGANYFAQFAHSLPTDPNFFPVGAWLEGVQTQQDINLDKAAGLDMYVGITANSNFSLIQNSGMYVIAQQDELKTNPTVLSNSSTTGWLLYDEIDLALGAGGYTTQNSIIASLPKDGTFTYNNYTKGVQFWETNAEAGRYVNGVDVASADIYWFTDPNFAMDGSDVVSWLNNGNPLSPSQIRLAANYGYAIDHLRAVDATDGVTHPIWGFVEAGWPFTAELKLSFDDEIKNWKLEFDFGEDAKKDGESGEPIDFSGQESLGLCPKDQGHVYEHGTSYVCEHAVGANVTCDFKSGKIILQQPVAREQMSKLLETGKTELLEGFVTNKTRRKFKARLAYDKKEGKVTFEFEPRAPRVPAAKKAAAKKVA